MLAHGHIYHTLVTVCKCLATEESNTQGLEICFTIFGIFFLCIFGKHMFQDAKYSVWPIPLNGKNDGLQSCLALPKQRDGVGKDAQV